MAPMRRVVPFTELDRSDVGRVGGKNASLGEMTNRLGAAGIRVPPGFATTAEAYEELLAGRGLRDAVEEQVGRLHRGAPLDEVGAAVRSSFLAQPLPPPLRDVILTAYERLAQESGRKTPEVAVRSSATAEDLPEASFAGQQETYLNVRGADALLEACRRCYASLFTDRAIDYRERMGFDHMAVALSVGVQLMVRSDLAGAGVAFTLDPESGFPEVIVVSAAWGLGETVVSGRVDPDEYTVFKPSMKDPALNPVIDVRIGTKRLKTVYADTGMTRTLDTTDAERNQRVLADAEISELAAWAAAVEEHYGCPMDLEWAKDGLTGELWIVQARPETVQSRRRSTTLRRCRLTVVPGEPLVEGIAVGEAIGQGPVVALDAPLDLDRFPQGGVLVTRVTDPDWEPVMKRASAIVTDHGGRTSHAAIVSRELGVPAVVGTGNGTRILQQGRPVTVSCAEGERGRVLDGLLAYEEIMTDLAELPATRTGVMLNLADPSAAFRWWRLPADGVGLARLEFIVAHQVKVHPMALLHPERLDARDRQAVEQLTEGCPDRSQYFVDRLAYGIARIAASRWPAPVIVRTSDFKTNEYAKLLGGHPFEPDEANPMIGWRGASRYYSEGYREGFALECRALRRVREGMGMTNVVVMIPFCRTLGEADQVLAVMAEEGLVRGEKGLRVYVMAEIPANIILAEDFADRFDGFSIGSNDLTQLTLGVDRDSEALAHVFDERDPAVVRSVRSLAARAHAAGRPVGLCGQRPSDDPAFTAILVDAGLDSISVAPDSFATVKRHVARAETALESAAGRREE
ncbi:MULTISPECIES: phosphoenolpyruvate synthase [unclassified Streptomyces]|uniref:phosphoenolpyruvate synthase n=1 Tax=unclassified Streptomyces TaxID=2593676 RepID=UPI0006F317FF|nr:MULTISPECIES: phosphoenolpyruvate synthase [unclassified Streptomyces]KQX46253.1 phosphoenolpyruvate synthase [Streptomyces sp. Root1304]KRA81038.1 phosphoenolpyruvate synthase [Streptomyces sp. Root66D1]